MQFHADEQDQVQKPVIAGHHPVGGQKRIDAARVHQHGIQVHRPGKKHDKSGHRLDVPQVGVGVLHHLHLVPHNSVLAPGNGKFAHP